MIHRFGKWLLLAAAAVLLAACGGSGDDDAAANSKAKTTLLVYMVASDLIPSAFKDLVDMADAKASKDVNVVIQIGGGSAAGDLPGIDLTKTRRYRLVPDADTKGQDWTIEPVAESEQPPQVAMNRTDTLRDFLQWGARSYPAAQYAAAMWNHGGGAGGGFGNDMALGGGTALSVNDIRDAFKQSGVHFEMVGFDACLMSSIEVASSLAPYANYLVASEEVTTGWNWTRLLDFLAERPSASGRDIGQNIVDNYSGSSTQPDGLYAFSAYAVTDLAKVAPVVGVIEQIAAELRRNLQAHGLPTWLAMSRARNDAQEFQTNIFSPADLVDVGSWVHELEEAELISPALARVFDAKYARAIAQIDGRAGDATGLMMYFPRYSIQHTDVTDRYAQVDFSAPYQQLVRDYVAFARSAELPQFSVGATQMTGNTALATVNVPANAPANGPVYDEAFGALVRDGVAVSLQTADAQGQQLVLPDAAQWPTVDGQVVTLLKGEEDDVYLIPVIEDFSSTHVGMLWALRDAQGRLVIRWYVNSQTAAGTTHAMVDVRPGMKFYPVQMDLATNQLMRAATPLISPQTGDWPVQKTALTGPGYTVHLAASSFIGDVVASHEGVGLPAGSR